jgi:osmotically inducible protein OsmC
MQRTASARWHGGAQDGSGTLTTQSGTLKDVPFTFKARFGDGKGTNPEELIAVAHAAAFRWRCRSRSATPGIRRSRSRRMRR